MPPAVNVKAATSIVELDETMFFIIVSLIDPPGEKRTSVFACIVSVAHNTVRTLMLNDNRIVNEPIFIVNPYLFIA
jgi:ABC-type lipopolysaccharide export system ATPase subunit